MEKTVPSRASPTVRVLLPLPLGDAYDYSVPEGMEVPPRTLVLGVPGRVKRELTADELARLDRSWRNYVEYKDRYLKG